MTQEHESETAGPESAAETAAEAAVAQADGTAADTLDPAAGEAEVGEVDALRAEIAALQEESLRTRAEVDNIRKRAERDVAAAHKYGLERLVQELLPVRDSLEMGLEAAASATEIESLREGMSLTAKMFGDFFDKLNISTVDPVGERFDPDFHQAMSTEESVEHEPGTVIRVMQKGYSLNDRLVRPALVVVSKAATD